MLKKTPLAQAHRELGARLVEFAGWEMPVHYRGIIEEHTAVRSSAGLFDISHMGRFLVIGPDAADYIQRVSTNDVHILDPGMSTYSLLCTNQGGILDDIFIYRLTNAFLVVVNAANTQKDRDFMLYHAARLRFNVKIVDYTDQWGMLALQGPQAEALLADSVAMLDDGYTGLADVPFHGIARATLADAGDCRIARTGYTGEDGFELFFDTSQAQHMWHTLLGLGDGAVVPCGLGARDSLRFEPCLPLYGHEITEQTNPYEARLGWAVKLDQGEFIGREALQQLKRAPLTRRLVGFEMVGRGVARSNHPIHAAGGDKPIGHVTSGMPAPTLGTRLGLGYVPADLASEGSEFDVMIRGRPARARVVATPFYKPRYKK